jgi:hypothetical protein
MYLLTLGDMFINLKIPFILRLTKNLWGFSSAAVGSLAEIGFSSAFFDTTSLFNQPENTIHFEIENETLAVQLKHRRIRGRN